MFISTQLYCGKTGLPFVKSLFNQLQLTNEKSKFTSTKVVGIIFIWKIFNINIWFEYNGTTEFEGIIQDHIENLRKTPIPQLPKFDGAASVLDVIDWIFKMASIFSKMNIFYSEMITIFFQKNERLSDLEVKYPHRSEIVNMKNSLTRIYLEAISTNKVIITLIPHRFFIISTNQLVLEIEAILLPPTP